MTQHETESGVEEFHGLLSVDGAAGRLGISRSSLYRLIGNGEVVPVKVGHRTLIEPAEIDRLIDRGRQSSLSAGEPSGEPESAGIAVVLLSGGLDSTTVLAIARDRGHQVVALSFDYGQRHSIELEAASTIASRADVAQHLTVKVDLRPVGGSALTSDVEVPKDRDESEMGEGIPVTYVPARNTVFLSYALAYAEVLEADDIWLGVNALDYSGYPDCRPEYVEAMEAAFNLATKRQVEGARLRVNAPLIQMSKAQIIARGLELGVDYSLTRSCYDPDAAGAACGHCDSCQLRLRGFAENGVADPAPYQAGALAA